MVFEIDESVPALFNTGTAQKQDAEGLRWLVFSAVEGSHRIVGRRKVLLELVQLDILEPRHKQALARAAGRVAQEGSLCSRVPVHGRVVANAQAVVSVSNGDKREITFPLRWFDCTARIQPTTLLAEDLSDVGVLELMSRAGIVLSALGYLPFKAAGDPGGGNNIGRVLSDHIANNRLCLCIVDSDQVCPGGDFGSTAQTVAPYKNDTTYPLVGVLETSGRDLENSLPNSFYRNAYGQDARYVPLNNLLDALTGDQEHAVRLHLDIEKGLRLHDVRKYPANSSEATFWQSKLNLVMSKVGIQTPNVPCLTRSSCPHIKRSDCQCVIITGNHADILKDFLDHHKDSDGHMLCQILDDSVCADWKRLGTAVASWCCGDSPIRI